MLKSIDALAQGYIFSVIAVAVKQANLIGGDEGGLHMKPEYGSLPVRQDLLEMALQFLLAPQHSQISGCAVDALFQNITATAGDQLDFDWGNYFEQAGDPRPAHWLATLQSVSGQSGCNATLFNSAAILVPLLDSLITQGYFHREGDTWLFNKAGLPEKARSLVENTLLHCGVMDTRNAQWIVTPTFQDLLYDGEFISALGVIKNRFRETFSLGGNVESAPHNVVSTAVLGGLGLAAYGDDIVQAVVSMLEELLIKSSGKTLPVVLYSKNAQEKIRLIERAISESERLSSGELPKIIGVEWRSDATVDLPEAKLRLCEACDSARGDAGGVFLIDSHQVKGEHTSALLASLLDEDFPGSGSHVMLLSPHSESTSAPISWQNFVYRFLNEADSVATQQLLNLSHSGVVPVPFGQTLLPLEPGVCQTSLHRLEKRSYRIRCAVLDDLEALMALELASWAEELRTPEDVIAQRLKHYPEGQLVVEMENQVAAVIYSHRIVTEKNLSGKQVSGVPKLHTPRGKVAHILGLAVLPELQSRKLGDQLLEFALQYYSAQQGVQKIVGVTRCKSYQRFNSVSHEEYILKRNSLQQCLDPHLSFHEQHGARVVAALPHYRPKDVDNNGYGVLVEYHTRLRHRPELLQSSHSSSEKNSRVEKAPVELARVDARQETVERKVVALIHQLKSELAGFLVDVAQPIMELGFDSIDMMELGLLITEHYGTVIDPLFFFENSTVRKVARKIIATSDVSRLPPQPEWQSAMTDVNNVAQNRTETLENALLRCVCEITGVAHSLSDVRHQPLLEMGVDSAQFMALSAFITQSFSVSCSDLFFFECNTLHKIACYIDAQQESSASRNNHTATQQGDAEPDANHGVAIVGFALRVPGAEGDRELFFDNLLQQQCATGVQVHDRWRWPEGTDLLQEHRGMDAAGLISGIENFDHEFFRISAAEAELMDPQQRILLEMCWQALEHAGYNPETLAGSDTGIFIGASGSDYRMCLADAGIADEAHCSTSVAMSVIPNRLSYFYNFNGPSLLIDTACSSSLVAIHEAAKSLKSGESRMAIAGGINIICHPANTLSYHRAGMLSRDGVCKTFSDDANGYVRGEGAGLVVLKPLADAERDGDYIYGVIRGSAINHGGQASGLSAPNPVEQGKLVAKAMANAGVKPEQVSYIEAHGTATPLGDPIEIEGLKRAFATGAANTPYCALGSVKTNIGHLEAAAGVAGLLKLLLAMQQQTLPGNANFHALNKKIQLEQSPFYVLQSAQPWSLSNGQTSRIAGVSSFGIGGANAHVVVEEYHNETPLHAANATQDNVFLLSAKTETALQRYVLETAQRFKSLSAEVLNANFNALCSRSQTAKSHFNLRIAIIATSGPELLQKLASIASVDSSETLQHGVYFSHSTQGLSGIDKHAFVSMAQQQRNLSALASLWVAGAEIDWSRISDAQRGGVALPDYPFEQTPLWFEKKQPRARIGKVTNTLEDVAHIPVWRAMETASTNTSDVDSATLLVYSSLDLDGAEGFVSHLLEEYQSHYRNLCSLDLSQSDAAQQISRLCEGRGVLEAIERVVLLAMPGEHSGEDAMQRGNALLQLCQGLMAATKVSPNLDFFLVTRDAYNTQYDTHAIPAAAALGGFMQSLARERSSWRIRVVDFSSRDDHQGLLKGYAFRAIQNETHNEFGLPVAFRSGMRLERKLSPVSFNESITGGLRQRGNYLIVGGAGGIGQQLTKYLIERYQARVVWLGRSELSESLQAAMRVCDPMGEALRYCQCDASDKNELDTLVQSLRDEAIEVHGVFNAAVATADAKVENLQLEVFAKALSHNLRITDNCVAAFSDWPLDFICLFSSIQSLQCDFGISLYGFISAYKDAFAGGAKPITATQGYPVCVVNWGYWPVGLGNDERVRQRIVEQIGMQPLSREEGMASLELTLARAVAQLAPVKLAQHHELGVIDNQSSSRVYQADMPQVKLQTLQQSLPERTGEYQLALHKTFNNPALVELGVSGLIKTFVELGAPALSHAYLPASEWILHLGIVERYHRFAHAALLILSEAGAVHKRNSAYQWNRDYAAASVTQEQLDKQCTQLQQDADMNAQAKLLHTCVSSLTAILKGESVATDIMFPESSMDLVAGIYKGNPAADYVNHRVADVIETLVHQQLKTGSQRPVRILELGAGTGGSSAFIFKRLSAYADNLEYYYTDVSRSFLLYAEDNYQPSYPYIKTCIFDLQKDINEQNIPEDYFDIVVAANVVHATDDILQVLTNVKRAMRTDGALVLNEITRRCTFLTLTFGLLDGWWMSADNSIRIPASPLLTPLSWRAVFASLGLSRATVVDGDATDLDQQVIVGFSNGVCEQPSLPAPAVKEPAALGEAASQAATTNPVNNTALHGESLQAWLMEQITAVTAKTLRTEAASIGEDQPFVDMGVDSILSVSIVKRLNTELQITLNSTDLFSYTTVELLAAHINERFADQLQPSDDSETASQPAPAKPSAPAIATVQASNAATTETVTSPKTNPSQKSPAADNDDIAIIGISCQFASARNKEEFWETLQSGNSLISEVPENRYRICPELNPEHFYRSKNDKHTSYSKWGGFLNDIDCFDASFFKISGDDAQNADPQQRLFLQHCWSALEDAAISGETIRGSRCGVFVGVEAGDYGVGYQQGIEAASLWGNATSIMAARISYFLNLKGPAITIDTACSSSLVALNSACQSLQLGETDVVLAGGVSLQTTPNFYVAGSQAHMLSPTGRCYTFDDRADGFVPGEGAAVLVLKRLQDALRDKDAIYGVIRGIGVNQDGATNGITAPSALSQKELLRRVYEQNTINPAEIGMVEAHGTGTKLGDPIEFEALAEVFGDYSDRKNYCALGSSKTNIGHTRAVAGIAGVVKACLSLKNELIPASLNYRRANGNINLQDSPFYVVTDNAPWCRDGDKPRLATVSSFGLSGTNAHAVIGEAPQISRPAHNALQPQLLPLSSKTAEGLLENAAAIERWLSQPGKGTAVTPVINEFIVAQLAEILAVPSGELNGGASLDELGLDPFVLAEFFDRLRTVKGVVVGHDALTGITKLDELCERIGDLYAASQGCDNTHRLSDIALTLQTGRSHFDVRAVIVASSIGEFRTALQQLLQTPEKANQPLVFSTSANEALLSAARGWLDSGKQKNLAGVSPEGAQRLNMPGYQFARDRYWKVAPALQTPAPAAQRDAELKSTSLQIEAQHPWLAEHVIEQLKILPGAAQVAIVRDSVAELFAEARANLSGLRWHKPAVAGAQSVALHIEIASQVNGQMAFELFQQGARERVLVASGNAHRHEMKESQAPQTGYRIADLVEQCPQHLKRDELYELYQDLGVHYGDSFRKVTAIFFSDTAAIGRIDAGNSNGDNKWNIAPGVLDAVFQVTTAVALPQQSQRTRPLQLPVGFDALEQYDEISGELYVYARLVNDEAQQRSYHIEVLNASGDILLAVKNFTTTALQPPEKTSKARNEARDEVRNEAKSELVLAKPSWQSVSATLPQYTGELVGMKAFVCDSFMQQVAPGESVIWDKLSLLALDHDSHATQRARYVFDVVYGELMAGFNNNSLLPMVVVLPESQREVGVMLSGLFKSASHENPSFWGSVLYLRDASCINELPELIAYENALAQSGAEKVYLGSGEFSQRVLQAVTQEELTSGQFAFGKHLQGVYWVTGGAGGLGRILAEHLALQHHCKVVISGRSRADAKLQAYLENIRAQGGQIAYMVCDVSKLQEVENTFKKIEFQFGELRGVLHCAGITEDALIRNKNWESIDRVFAAKLAGVAHLDAVTAAAPLDIFLCYSSLAGVVGNLGQSDYAAANAFLDGFMAARRERVARGECHGSSVSVSWPLWQSEGMMPNDLELARMRSNLGLTPMPQEMGMAVVDAALAAPGDQWVVGYGNRSKIESLLFADSLDRNTPAHSHIAAAVRSSARVAQPVVTPSHARVSKADDATVLQAVQEKLIHIFADVLKLPSQKIQPQQGFDNFGINSLSIMAITDRLEDLFGEVSKTLLYEYNTIAELAEFMRGGYPEVCAGFVDVEEPPVDTITEAQHSYTETTAEPSVAALAQGNSSERFSPRERFNDEIAIVGIAGQYPQSDDLDEFWKNLISGTDCVTEIPQERWSLDSFFDAKKGVRGKSFSKWGGFLRHVDKFDPMFFNIAPRDAIAIDPQERLFLQTVWQAMENAGYTRSTLKNLAQQGDKVGVYVGVMYEEYQFHGIEATAHNAPLALAGNPSSIANRVSYFLDLNGPCMAVDTMCSSSLTAIHLACQSIKAGECKVAIAGGVNVSVHPNKYLYLSQNNVVSTKGRCEAFGEGGDGYVPSEGVGALILKPLSQAIADGDVIHGLVKGTGINHGGKTNGFTVPNPNAQAEVIAQAIEAAGVSANELGYLEAHGTGTALGDPIEISGLSKAFEKFTDAKQFCAIGSAKSNIGHCESAAGVAGISKVLLQMRHGQFAPSLHCEPLNSKIDFSKSPFYVQKNAGPWPQQSVIENGERIVKPRLAGVSSFGAGGSNAHVIIQEYVTPGEAVSATELPVAIVCSARTKAQLQERLHALSHALQQGNYSDADLASIACTLQCGREALAYRLAFVVNSLEELQQRITQILDSDNATPEGVYRGDTRSSGTAPENELRLQAPLEAMPEFIAQRDYEKLLSLWVQGGDLDWSLLYQSNAPKRLALPGYPFARERYWVDVPSARSSSIHGERLHPLLHSNATRLNAPQCYRSEFTGNEFFLSDHQVQGDKILPGVAYLEMARAAVQHALALPNQETTSITICDSHWLQPAKVSENFLALQIELQERSSNEITYRVSNDAEQIHSQGRVILSPATAQERADIAALQRATQQRYLSAEHCYELFTSMGLHYGETFQGLEELFIGEQQLLARLTTAATKHTSETDWVLHPSVLDSSLQATVGLLHDDSPTTYLPYSLGQLQIVNTKSVPAWVWVRASGAAHNSKQFDIDLLSEEGEVCITLRHLNLRALQASTEIENSQTATDAAPAISVFEQTTPEPQLSVVADSDLIAQVSDVITEQLAQALGMESQWINHTESFNDYGLDSINGIQLVESLNRELSITLDVTAIFDYASVKRLARFIYEQFSEMPFAQQSTEQTTQQTKEVQSQRAPQPVVAESPQKTAFSTIDVTSEKIAIVGASGRFAQSPDLNALWQHLAEGADLITDVDRWDITPNTQDLDPKRICAEGSFLQNIDAFDARFFSISGAEAIYMDPQQRVFLEEAWLALEDAGYAGGVLEGQDCGIYVGCNDGDYQNLFLDSPYPAQAFWGNSGSILPARIAYLLDLKGPALAIDTACSSSLVAIHTACMALRSGEVNYALAGGVFIQSTAEFYQYSNRAGMLSPRGRCHSFDARADGFVPGEGAGVILLKRLSDALADGDHIHGVIAGSACNQDGATNGITAPSANSQERLQRQVYDRYGINADSIQMVEAHGTGTMLGDPIEFQALTRSFRKDTSERNYCALGSIKSNLGHTATAAGVSGVLKILLAMKHQQLPPSLHFEQGNPNIDFDNSPFYVNTQLRDWPANRNGQPRRAAVSSFGFSGTNVHMVIDQGPQCERVSPARPGHLVVLSADSEAQLHTLVERHLAHLQSNPELDLGHLSYTLLQGRKHLNQRLACVVSDREQLRSQWQAFLNKSEAGALRGDLKQNPWRNNHEAQQAAQQHLENAAGQDHNLVLDALQQLAQAYCAGCPLDWSALFTSSDHADQNYARLSLPGYPFTRQRYWIGEQSTQSAIKNSTITNNHAHPLIHSNESNFEQQQYRSVFTGNEVFLRDHKVRGDAVLPGVAYLEMAREAIQRSIGSRDGVLELCDVEWRAPITVSDTPVEIHTELQWQNEALHFSVRSADTLHSVGQAQWREAEETVLPLQELQAAMSAERSGEDCYQNFNTLGIHYGASHQCIERLWCGEGAVLAQLRQTEPTHSADYLDPGLLDSALQCAVGFMSDAQQLAIPRSVAKVCVHRIPQGDVWVVAREISRNTEALGIDLDVCDNRGRILLSMHGVNLHFLSEKSVSFEASSNSFPAANLSLYRPMWTKATAPGPAAHSVVLCDLPQRQTLAQQINRDCVVVSSSGTTPAQRFLNISLQLQDLLTTELKAQPNRHLLFLIPPALQGLCGMLRSAQKEYPNSCLQTLLVEESANETELLDTIARGIAGDLLRCNGAVLEMQQWQPVHTDIENSQHRPWREQGVYLITGGAGGLGLIVAREIAQRAPGATLVLTGRRDNPENLPAALRELTALGAQPEYQTMDVSDAAAVNTVVTEILQNHGALHGVFHSAGVLQDSLLARKTAQQFEKVFAPKVAGIVNLDNATASAPLDWFIACSSASAVLGNAGQCDYAAANGFMDNYLQERQVRVQAGECSGVSLSINWPLWAEGGMGLNETLQQRIWETLGVAPMPTELGLQALHCALQLQDAQALVLYGSEKCSATLALAEATQVQTGIEARESSASPEREPEVNVAALEKELAALVANILCINKNDVDAVSDFGDFGFDSISLTKFAGEMNSRYGVHLTPALFYEHSNLEGLIQYLLSEHSAAFAPQPTQNISEKTNVESPAKAQPVTPGMIADVKAATVKIATAKPSVNDQDIAVIGISACFPKADDMHEYWQNLLNNRDCIDEIPATRWNWQEYFGEPEEGINQSNVKWGGFMRGADEFDPLFFGISPGEAKLMDPNQRLIMQYCWQAIEDAGYSAESLAGSDTGIFVGTGCSGYTGLLTEAGVATEAQTSTGMAASVGPNRMSFFLDVHGPSEPVETACSSSLVAIHRAVKSLQQGESTLALAGGVNALTSPHLNISFNKAGMLCEDGRCKTFSDEANGYVRAEGAGILLLKKLSDAQRDGDHIYAVIKGTAENHGGRANSLTAPNTKAQAAVIKKAIEQANIDPASISYIEAHGTGTSLGDPVEINGLKSAFAQLGVNKSEQPFCGIGSVKSNIGHAELAAGVAGLVKVILQMKHKQLVASLHCDTVNPYIELSGSPFFIVNENQPWLAPVDDEGKVVPRRAGISSFGFGGANAHVIVEEYVEPQLPVIALEKPALIVLSARTEGQLQERIASLSKHLNEQQLSDAHLAHLAYTLQVGREAMTHRIALITHSMADLRQQLQWLCAGEASRCEVLFRGKVEKQPSALLRITQDAAFQLTLDAWLAQQQYDKLLSLWVQGLAFDWQTLYRNGSGSEQHALRRVSLPGYPFARDRYWVENNTASRELPASQLHPLLHSNNSSLNEGQSFYSQFSGEEFFLADYRIHGEKVLPGAACLELAREAVCRATGRNDCDGSALVLKQVRWPQSAKLSQPAMTLTTGLEALHSGDIAYRIRSGAALICEGLAEHRPLHSVAEIDLNALRRACTAESFDTQIYYRRFRDMGLEYGRGFQSLTSLYLSEKQLLAEVAIPKAIAASEGDFVLHPCLLDACLQSTIAFLSSQSQQLFMPVAMAELEIISACNSPLWVWVKRIADGDMEKQFDMTLADANGKVCGRIRGLTLAKVATAVAPRPLANPLLTKPLSTNPTTGQSLMQALKTKLG